MNKDNFDVVPIFVFIFLLVILFFGMGLGYWLGKRDGIAITEPSIRKMAVQFCIKNQEKCKAEYDYYQLGEKWSQFKLEDLENEY